MTIVPSIEVYKSVVEECIEGRATDLNDISQQIWKKPELGFEEREAHDLLANFLQKEGFTVSRNTPLETSFVARYGASAVEREKSGQYGRLLKVGVCCEYDALPGIGHACGHNLIAEAGIAAALGLKAAIDSDSDLLIEVIVYGTPAEEGGGGKVFMIEKGVFDEVNICMMSHPTPVDIAIPYWLARVQLKVVFKGKTAHAAAAPWEGINALDAAVACYNNVSMMRQQMKPNNRIHGIIVDGGQKPNIIPERSELSFYVRALTMDEAVALSDRVRKCAEGAASATGCSVEVEETAPRYDAVRTDPTMISLYKKHATAYGVDFLSEEDSKKVMASTDFGNITQRVPAIHPLYKIETGGAVNHTHAFTATAGHPSSQAPTLVSAKCMALTAIEIACDSDCKGLLKRMKAELGSK